MASVVRSVTEGATNPRGKLPQLDKSIFFVIFQQTYEIGIFFVWQDNMVIVSLVSVCMAAMALAALRRVHSTHLRSVEVANA